MYTATNTNKKTAGFTLVEILVVAPIVILSITFLVALMVSLVGSVMTSKERSAVIYETQATLNAMEQDIITAGAFSSNSGAMISPQGRDDLTAAWTTGQDSAFIIEGFATDKNPLDTARKPIFYMNKPNACGATENMNTPFTIKTIYYLRNGSLWRRTYLPTYNTNTGAPDANTVCAAPWQRNSCKVGYTDTTRCKTNDVEVLKGVTNFTVSYYESSTATATTTPDNATVVNVSITVSKTVSGNTITNTSYLKVAKQNKLYDRVMPETPIITATKLSPRTVQFSWPTSGDGVKYDIYQNLNGSAWTMYEQNSTNLNVTLSAYPTDTIGVKVEAKNSNGTASGTAVYNLPRWTPAVMQNGWVSHTPATYNDPEYTITKTGEVFLHGVIKSGTTTSGTLLFTLPADLRPNAKLIFPVASALGTGNGVGRIDILTNGQVQFVAGENGYLSLDNIRFMSAGSCTMNTLTMQNSWTNTGSPYPANTTACVTSDNRVHVQGVVQNATVSAATIGTAGTPVAIAPLPSSTSYDNTGQQLYPSSGYSRNYYNVGIYPPTTKALVARGQYTAGSTLSAQIDYANTAVTGWNSPTDLSNSWVNYGGAYATFGYTKVANDVVTLKGTVKSSVSTDADNGRNIEELVAGYFPIKRMIFLTHSNAAACRLDVKNTGTIEVQGSECSTSSIAIDSITFIAEL